MSGAIDGDFRDFLRIVEANNVSLRQLTEHIDSIEELQLSHLKDLLVSKALLIRLMNVATVRCGPNQWVTICCDL